MIFKDREDAGRQLANRLSAYANRNDVIVLGIPRGGVPVAFEIAQALNLPMDIFLSRKLGVPGREELAFGAIAAGDGRFLDREMIQALGISERQIEHVTAKVKETLSQRAELYRGDRGPLQIEDRTVILVDDGIATGASIYAAINALQQMKPAKLVIAVPVAPPATCEWLRSVVNQVICITEPEQFYAVGQFYRHFSQVPDKEVIDLLQRAWRMPVLTSSPAASAKEGIKREVSIEAGNVLLPGTLTLPKNAKEVVVFAHGSGSSRHSPRNRQVAKVLQAQGLGTLLFDLLSKEEELLDQQTAELRFNIGLLTARLVGVTKWVTQQTSTKTLPIGYFGASTGAAAALAAAAQLPDLVAAVVSRGGRPDLAAEALGNVHASVLLLVGALDEKVVGLNRQALKRLQCQNKQLVLIPGATHLFEEPGTLEQVAQAAAAWFTQHLAPDHWSKGSHVGASAEADHA
jgi:putative phosphoribosyl transferase